MEMNRNKRNSYQLEMNTQDSWYIMNDELRNNVLEFNLSHTHRHTHINMPFADDSFIDLMKMKNDEIDDFA